MEKRTNNIRVPDWLWYSIVIGSYFISSILGYCLTALTLYVMFMLPNVLTMFSSNILKSNNLSLDEMEGLHKQYTKELERKSRFTVLWVTLFKYNTIWFRRYKLEERVEAMRQRILFYE